MCHKEKLHKSDLFLTNIPLSFFESKISYNKKVEKGTPNGEHRNFAAESWANNIHGKTSVRLVYLIAYCFM